jgi:hypothetical protein
MSETRVALDVISVRSPCPASWDAMAGDERSRFCDHCGLHVHNLSAMTLDEAQRLVCERAGRMCVRFERDAAGRVVTLNYRNPRPRDLSWRLLTLIGMASAIASAVVRFVLWNPSQPVKPVVELGAIDVPTTSPAPALPRASDASLDSPRARS